MGIAGFSHDFGTLDGKVPPVLEVFDSFLRGGSSSIVSTFMVLLAPILPLLIRLPTRQNRLMQKLRLTMTEIAHELLARTRKEMELKRVDESAAEKSIIGLLSMFKSSKVLGRAHS